MSFFRRKKFVVNEPDPVFNVTYLGNVITLLARGESCFDKPLALIWRTYCTKKRPDMAMKLIVTRSGLKAHTKQQGLTEYWVHRTTFCAAPEDYPRVFVWIYKHDGKKMKPELRCHAALCRRVDTPRVLADALQMTISGALSEYRREKLSKQNVRISSGGSLPRRKQILSTGTQNFRPPMARSKSAPKLQAIEECLEEEEPSPEEEDDDSISIPSSAGFSVNNSPTGGCRQHNYLFADQHSLLPLSETAPDLSGISPQSLRLSKSPLSATADVADMTSMMSNHNNNNNNSNKFSAELDHVTDRLSNLSPKTAPVLPGTFTTRRTISLSSSSTHQSAKIAASQLSYSPPLIVHGSPSLSAHSLPRFSSPTLSAARRHGAPGVDPLDEVDQYSDESGYEEKTSLESCDEIPEKILTDRNPGVVGPTAVVTCL